MSSSPGFKSMSLKQRQTQRQTPAQARRINNACQRCKARKIRCDGRTPMCGKCETQGAECVYGERKWRGKGRTHSHMKELEQRLEKMEKSLRPSKTTSQNGDEQEDRAEVDDLTVQHEEVAEHEAPEQEVQAVNVGRECEPERETQPMSDRFRKRVAEIVPPICLVETSNRRKVFVEMVDQPNAMFLVGQYLESVNAVEFPVFHAASLLSLVRTQFPNDADSCGASWWACLNTLVATTVQLKAISRAQDFEKVSGVVWNFFKNAWVVYEEIIVRPSILGVQTLLVMARFLEQSTDMRLMSIVISSAIRMLQVLVLDREPMEKVSEAEREQRRRVFWCAYLMDKRGTIELGLPPMLDISPIGFPESIPSDGVGCVKLEDGRLVNVFVLRIELSMLETRLRKCLIDSMSEHSNEDTLTQLLNDVEIWAEEMPTDIRPSHEIRLARGMSTFPIIMLHLAYYHCTSVIQGTIAARSERENRAPCLLMHQRSADAARPALRLAGYIEPGLPFVKLWRLLRYFLSATTALAAGVIAYPRSLRAPLDVEHLSAYVSYLEALQEREGCDIKVLFLDCRMLSGVARAALNGKSVSGSLAKLQYVEDHLLVAQARMGNMPRLGATGFVGLDTLLDGVEGGADVLLALFSPQCLRPETYGFGKVVGLAGRVRDSAVYCE